ncbi:hypothetical protein [Klenkia brasiliensis]|uniref:Uncharacterized protein n=1 Tax=Klenkia brasiliensis TaxID=333142 RepID=A0A1G7YJN2_9ACTN|nr:hypothetical protein [Klenkia brasiliensis]SDG96020.1 hypothetical protein SAMN05660324_3965 [Klenkia brasiliensis]
MTADQQPAAAPLWRVKMTHRAGTWTSLGMTEAAAVAEASRLARLIAGCGDGAAMLAFTTRHGVEGWVRAREVRCIEPVGPRWEGDEGPVRVADLGSQVTVSRELADADPDEDPTGATAWLQKRAQQQADRIRADGRARSAGGQR